MHRQALRALVLCLAAPALLLAAPESAPRVPEAAPAATAQPVGGHVRWRPFGAEAFREAAEARKPILLYISAWWDHHDRAMSDFTYTDPAVVALAESAYVPVLVDTDRRPDVFSRYGMGSWPTTAVLLPDGHPLYYPDKEGKTAVRAGGSFYPPREFVAYFRQLADYHAANREMVERLSEATDRAILERRNAERADVAADSLEAVVSVVVDAYGRRPDTPVPGDRHPDFEMMDMAFAYWQRKPDRKVLDIALNTLTDMGRGGIYDRLGGGFFRYGHDSMFVVPAFEKMPGTNARAILAYLKAFQVTGNGAFLRFAEGTIDHVRRIGIDPVSRAVRGPVAAWARPGDNGDYYTWTEEEFRAPLTEEEFRLAAAAFNISPYGEMVDHAPKRNVIFLSEGPKLLASRFGIDEKKAEATLESARRKLLEAREKRPAPPVDPRTYGDWTAMTASAFLMAGATLQRPELTTVALENLDLLMARCRTAAGLIAHACRPDRAEAGAEAFFADQAWMATALVDAYEATGTLRYLTEARALADRASEAFRDVVSDGFTDAPPAPEAPGLLAWPVRDLRDNMKMSEALLRLHAHTGQESYRTAARRTLESWADEFGNLKMHSSPYATAAWTYLNAPVEILVIGDAADPETAAARARAAALWHPWRIVRHMTLAEGTARLKSHGIQAREGAQVAFCLERECAGPWPAGEPLRSKLDAFLNRGGAQQPAPAQTSGTKKRRGD